MWRFVPPPAPSQQADLALREYAVTEGDHVTLLNVYNAFLDNNRSASWCHVNCYIWLLDKPARAHVGRCGVHYVCCPRSAASSFAR